MNGIVSGKTVDELSAYGKISEYEHIMTFSQGWASISGEEYIYVSQSILWLPVAITSAETNNENFSTKFRFEYAVVESSSTLNVYTFGLFWSKTDSSFSEAGIVNVKFKVIEVSVDDFILTCSNTRYRGSFKTVTKYLYPFFPDTR